MSFVVYDRQGEDLYSWWRQNAWEEGEACADIRIGAAVSSLEEFGVRVTPTHLWLSKDGTVLRSESGALNAVPEWLVEPPR